MEKRNEPRRVEQENLPIDNLVVYQLIKTKEQGNKTQFAKKIGAPPQKVSSWFYPSKRTGAYPRISRRDKAVITRCYGFDDNYFETEGDKIRQERRADSGFDGGVAGETRPHFFSAVWPGSLKPGEAAERSERMPVIKFLPEYDCTFPVNGDGMEPTYRSGDIIAMRNVSNSGFVQWGLPYVIGTRHGAIVRRVFPDEKGGGFKCVADNKDYAPFVVPRDEVFGLYKVVGVIHVES